MAQHVCEGSVFERRLRPIYDSLEVGNNKKALQEVEKLLKKTPTLTCARALKALALLRLGREEESNALLSTLSEEKPSDDATLQVLTFCYKEMEQLEKICELYQHAAKQTPGNEEILAHLFISYVRLNDYKAQQATALQLYKSKAKNPYYFWAVMSVVLQGVRGPESSIPEKRKLYLALAQRMVDKLISEDKLDAEQEVQLYINILEEQGKHKEALDFMEGALCERLYPGAPISMKIELLKKIKLWERLHALVKELLIEERDRWDYYKEYLTSCFEIYKLKPQTDNSIPILDECHDFLCQLIESGKRVRGPYLARLEMHKRMTENNLKSDDLLGEFKSLVLEYFRLFGHKACCTNDIAMFLHNTELQDRLELASKLLRESGISSTTLPQSRDQMQKHICSLQLSRICGSHIGLGSEHLLALYTALRLHYEHGLSTFGKDLLPTDLGPSDAYALLAAHVMYDVSYKESKAKHLLEALCLLHYVLNNSPSNFHAKLLCLKIYHFFGCGLGAQQIYESLDIKHVQLDSMGYLHCLLLLTTALPSVSKTVYDGTLKFFTTSYKERLEYIAMSYKFGSFSKLQEFMDFRDRLSNSLHYAASSAEELLLELVCLSGTVSQNLNTYKLMSINPQDDRIHWDELADNRDLSVVVSWNPIDMVDYSAEKSSFDQDIESLRIRSHLLRLVSAMVDLFHITNKPTSENCIKATATSIVELLKHSWDELFQRLHTRSYIKPINQFLVNLLPSHLHVFLEMPYHKFFSYLAQFLVDLYVGSNLGPERITALNELVTLVSNICCDSVRDHNEADDGVWIRRDFQTRIYCAIEMLSLYAFILSVCHEKFAASQNIQAKKNKKKDTKQQINDDSILSTVSDKDKLQFIVDLMRHLKQQFQNCNNAIAGWRSPNLNSSLTECMAGMSLNPKTENALLTDVCETFRENHIQVVRDLRNIIKDKLRMVNK